MQPLCRGTVDKTKLSKWIPLSKGWPKRLKWRICKLHIWFLKSEPCQKLWTKQHEGFLGLVHNGPLAVRNSFNTCTTTWKDLDALPSPPQPHLLKQVAASFCVPVSQCHLFRWVPLDRACILFCTSCTKCDGAPSQMSCQGFCPTNNMRLSRYRYCFLHLHSHSLLLL